VTNSPATPPATAIGAYAHWVTDVVRFSDQNVTGHLNSVAIAAYVESGRVAFAHSLPVDDVRSTLMLARQAIDYHAEAHYPGVVRTGTRLRAIGRTSLTLGHGLFEDDICIATAEEVLVHHRDGQSIPIDGELRRVLERVLAERRAEVAGPCGA
jgi:acyl-CoA thioester hydrolase